MITLTGLYFLVRKQYRVYIDVSCFECNVLYSKRLDSTKEWSGRCVRCSNIHIRNRPDVNERIAKSTSKRLLENGGIKNAKKFDGSYSGSKHWCWKGGITPVNRSVRTCSEYSKWRNKVFTRDKHTCQECGQIGCYLNADHYPVMFKSIMITNNIKSLSDAKKCKELWDINNGRTLCKPCHKENHINI